MKKNRIGARARCRFEPKDASDGEKSVSAKERGLPFLTRLVFVKSKALFPRGKRVLFFAVLVENYQTKGAGIQ